MKPKLFVHIGGAKCGSTSIQTFLAVNRTSLADRNMIVPGPEMTPDDGRSGNQIWFFQNLIGKPDAGDVLSTQLDGLIAAHQQGHGGQKTDAAPSILVSAENLSNPNGLHEIFGSLIECYDVHVLLYIRRQEDAYMSGWQQWFVKTNDDLDRWIEQTTGFFTDWRKTILDWEGIGAASVTVRLFERGLLANQDVVEDYCGWLGLESQNYRLPGADVNVTQGAHIAQLMHDCRALFANEHDTFFEHKLFEMKIASAAKRSGEVIFTREQIETVRARYVADNAWIKETYFPDLARDDLFPRIDYESVSKPDQTEINRRNIAVLTELVMKMLNAEVDYSSIPVTDQPGVSRKKIAVLTGFITRMLKAGRKK